MIIITIMIIIIIVIIIYVLSFDKAVLFFTKHIKNIFG